MNTKMEEVHADSGSFDGKMGGRRIFIPGVCFTLPILNGSDGSTVPGNKSST